MQQVGGASPVGPTISEVLGRASSLPPAQRSEAFRLLHLLTSTKEAQANRTRDARQRASYAGNPSKYIRDILGSVTTSQQDYILEEFEANDKVLVASANNLGKTWILSAYGLYKFDAVAALPDPEDPTREQGCKLLLPGPNHDTVFATIYASLISHAARAERRGYPMPGEYSELSVHWPVRPQWDVEAFSPRQDTKQDVSQSASGRHHVNMLAAIEEGPGTPNETWKGVEGMCSARGNKIISVFNPTKRSGPAYDRSLTGTYKIIHLSAMDHPNVRSRSISVPGAVSYTVVDDRVRDDCRDRGSVADVAPDPVYNDFAYALPPGDWDQYFRNMEGEREDGIPGHPVAEARIFRPNPGSVFEGQVLGLFPRIDDDGGLFDSYRLDQAMAMWDAIRPPDIKPDAVGADFARTGGDEICTAPRWGKGADSLIRGFAFHQKNSSPEVLEEYIAANRVYVGRIRSLSKGEGSHVAGQVHYLYPQSLIIGDEGGVGASPVDILSRVLHHPTVPVSFGASAPPPPPSVMAWAENYRTYLYLLAARLVAIGMVAVPHDKMLREELLTHLVEHKFKWIKRFGRRTRVPSIILEEKDNIKDKLGRSPDHSDAFVLSLLDSAVVSQGPKVQWIKRDTLVTRPAVVAAKQATRGSIARRRRQEQEASERKYKS